MGGCELEELLGGSYFKLIVKENEWFIFTLQENNLKM